MYLYDLKSLVSWKSAASFLLVGLLLPSILRYVKVLRQRRQLPPGPHPWPLFGNTLSLPKNKPWIYFEQLSKDYNSPVVTVWLGSKPTVWLNDAWVADELLNKRAAIYSSRPELIVFRDLGTGPSNIISMRYDSRWRDMRKVTHHGIGMQQTRSYRTIQDNESKQIPYDIMHDPKNYVAHLERYATSVVSIIGFGRRLQTIHDPIISEVLYVMMLAGELNVPSASMPMLMETFPILAKAPNWVPWKAKTRNRRKGVSFFYALAKEAAEDNPNENTCKTVFGQHVKNFKMTKREIANVAGNLFGAGAETSSNTLITFVLACVAFPQALARAWEELDRVVGHDHSPTFADQETLPYINAFVTEVFRWRSTAILSGQPHATTQEDVWNGYVFPKDCWVQANLWAIHRHPREFPDPDKFDPARHLASNRPAYPNTDGYNTFGYGRRICAGKSLAEQGIFITCARLLWSFNITKDVDAKGEPIPVDIFAYSNGLNIRPEPFPARFIVRSEAIKATIEREAKEALAELERFNVSTKYRLSDMGSKHKIDADLA